MPSGGAGSSKDSLASTELANDMTLSNGLELVTLDGPVEEDPEVGLVSILSFVCPAFASSLCSLLIAVLCSSSVVSSPIVTSYTCYKIFTHPPTPRGPVAAATAVLLLALAGEWVAVFDGLLKPAHRYSEKQGFVRAKLLLRPGENYCEHRLTPHPRRLHRF